MVKRAGVDLRRNGGVLWFGVARRIVAHRRSRITVTGCAALLGLALLANSPAVVAGVGGDHAGVGGAPAELARGASGERLLYSIDETLPHLRGSDRTSFGAVAGSGAAASAPVPTRADTVDFGFYEIREDGLKYAVRGESWTFDHGAEDPCEGWVSVDMTENLRDYWRQVTEASWLAEGNPLPWPQMTGAGMVLCGSRSGEADTLGWASGIGYGNRWCQRLTSPVLVYDGSGSVELSLLYFQDSELNFDYGKVFIRSGGTSTLLNSPGFSGKIGIDTLGVITPRDYGHSISNAELGGGTSQREFTLVFEFFSDGGVSDEGGAGGWDSFYGAWGVDDVVLGGNLVPDDTLHSGFESGLEGWTASRCPGIGAYLGIAPVTAYNILDPCSCRLAGNVMELHDPAFTHPDGQNEMTFSPIVDRRADLGDPGYLEYNRILAEWDMYAELPMENGVFYRSGWSYYPYQHPHLPGLVQWSPRIGINTFFYAGSDPTCYRTNNVGTDWGLPLVSQKVKFIFELHASCEAFGVDPCSGVTNFTPVLDNLRVRNIHVPNAPAILFATGMQFQDGFGQSAMGIPSPNDPGNADATYNLRWSSNPARLGDSLAITGPVPGASTKWEAKLWFRLKRTGPGQNSIAVYNTWKNAMMVKGIDFFTGPDPAFTWGYMDSVEVGTGAAKNKFCSQFRDGPSSGGWNLPADVCFNWGGGGEQGEGNEILPDLCFTPGTKIEYFVSSNYICLPETCYLLPDTAGGYCAEFEILPGYRLDDGAIKMPQVLYIDAFNRSRLDPVEEALNLTLYDQDHSTPLPDLPPWDRYDYLDASSHWNASFYRQNGGNNGATLPQLLCYRMIVLSTGTFGTGATEVRDWQGLQQWLESAMCESNVNPQGLLLDGALIAEIVRLLYPAFLSQWCGTVFQCQPYNEEWCPGGEIDNDENVCVRLEPTPGSPLDPGVPIDLFGNWCPSLYPFAVLGTTGAGQGSKTYAKIGSGTQTEYAQIIRDGFGQPGRYRTVLNGYSAYQLTARDLEAAPDPGLECPADSASRVTAAAAELKKSIQWALNISYPEFLGVRWDPCNYGMDAPEVGGTTVRVDALYPNRPNPFNPRTTIRYSLAADGPAKVEIFDVQGRRVRTLVDEPRTAGPNEAIWDGADDEGRGVGSGVYWYRLSTAGYVSNRKMVIVK